MKNEPRRAMLEPIPQRAKKGFQKSLKKSLKVGAILPVLGLLGASLSVPRIARAKSGNHFLETMGISIAVGTVLGASTLPFYDSPGSHLLTNLGYGASAGAVTGLGIMIYSWIAGPGHEDMTDEYGLNFQPGKSAHIQSLNLVVGGAHRASGDTGPAIARSDYRSPRSGPVYPAQFWTPVVSLNW